MPRQRLHKGLLPIRSTLMEPSSRKIRSGGYPAIFVHAPAPQTFPRLWEPRYRERYYQQKFAVEYTDQDFKKKDDILRVIISTTFIIRPCRITTYYIQGLAWVLAYYYQGVRLHLYPYRFTVSDIQCRHLHGNGIILSISPPLPSISTG